MSLGAQVPFPDMSGGVTGALEHLRQRHLVQLHPVRVGRAGELAPGLSHILGWVLARLHGLVGCAVEETYPVGKPQACRGPAGKHCRPRGGTERRRRVGIGEFHALRTQAVDVRGFVELAAETGDVGPPEVVDVNENDVGARVGRFCRPCPPWRGHRGSADAKGLEEPSPCPIHIRRLQQGVLSK
jgi:hypothetical protein